MQDTDRFTDKGRDIYSVSRLTTEVRFALEQGFPLLWVQGEIGNLASPRSGHLYFNLKDPQAQVRCAMFRNKANLLRFRPKEGDQVLLRGRLSLYEARGDFQLIVESMEPAGEGALRQALEVLKQKLAAEGLFDPARKRPLPALPRRVGIVTSPSGAAVRDVLTVLRRRFAAMEAVIYPIPVQGAEAPAAICAMLRRAERRRECDLLILTRGGGSLEDLMAFNDEGVARTLAELELPVVSAIGHEIDFTLADLAADRRAPTPSAAAELVSPDTEALARQLTHLGQRLQSRLEQHLDRGRSRLESLAGRLELNHPARRLQQREQRLDELQQRLLRSMSHRHQRLADRLASLDKQLQARHPRLRLLQAGSDLDKLAPRLQLAMDQHLERARQRLGASARELHAVSPLATLDRGYAIARKLPEGTILRDADQLTRGDRLEIRLARGQVEAEVV